VKSFFSGGMVLFHQVSQLLQTLVDCEFRLILMLCLVGITSIATISPFIDSTKGKVFGNTKLIYGCDLTERNIHCDPVPNRFSSLLVSGQAEEIYEVIPSFFDGVPGKYGNGLPLKGYIDEYFTIPNSLTVSPNVFSIAFWSKQDPEFDLGGTIIAHSDSRKTAGWYIGTKIKPIPMIQFSVVNTDGKVFTARSTISEDQFEFVTGVFDGAFVKLYLNGMLKNQTQFIGSYRPDPNGPLNIGVDSFEHTNAWKGVVDEVRIFDRAIAEIEMTDIMNGNYTGHNGLVGYWPFDNSTNDASESSNDGKVSTQAVSMAFSSDGRLFFTEKNLGEVKILKADKILPEPFVKISDLYVAQHQGLLGITLDPNFDTNHFVYIYYTSNASKSGTSFNKVVRFTELDNKAVQEKVLLDNIPASPEGEFAGGALQFGLDDKLYISIGHANSAELPQNMSSLVGKVLRINRDGTVPSDNPFPNSSIYTLGHRNIFGIAFDKKSGLGIVTENGDAHYDEINILEKGGNYGFAMSQVPTKSPLRDNISSVKPVRAYWETIAPTQAIFYDANKFVKLKDKLLFGSYNQGFIYALGLNRTGSVTDELAIQFPYDDNVDSIVQSPSGDIYFGGYNIYRLSSINMEQPEQAMYFIEFTLNEVQVDNLQFDIKNASLSFDAKSNDIESGSPSSIQVRIPKALLSGISEVSTLSSYEDQNDSIISQFDIKQQYRTANVGDTIIDNTLKNGLDATVSIKGVNADNMQ
jgi:glucose/arabinose dehydrogenase